MGKSLNGFVGVAYVRKAAQFSLSNVPKSYRISGSRRLSQIHRHWFVGCLGRHARRRPRQTQGLVQARAFARTRTAIEADRCHCEQLQLLTVIAEAQEKHRCRSLETLCRVYHRLEFDCRSRRRPSPSKRTCRRGKEPSPWDVSLTWAADRQDTFYATYLEPLITSASDRRFRRSTRRLRQQDFVCRCARTTSARLSQRTGETQELTLRSPEYRVVVQDVVLPCEERGQELNPQNRGSCLHACTEILQTCQNRGMRRYCTQYCNFNDR